MPRNYVKQSEPGVTKSGAGAAAHNIIGRSTYYGLADLGFGYPELGIFSLREIEAIDLPLGLKIARDLAFTTRHRLSVWAEASRLAGSIPDAADLLNRLTREDPGAIRLLPR